MRNKFMRFGALILSTVLLMSAMTVFAKTSVSDRILSELSAFGILVGDDNGNLNLDDNVTRAEFTAIIVRTLNAGDSLLSAPDLPPRFNDISPDDWFYDYVNILTDMRIINGFDDGGFHPYDKITLDQALKVITIVLGYAIQAEQSGGYPSGYSSLAARLGVIKGVSIDSEMLTRADIAVMIYNSLDISLMEATAYYPGEISSYRPNSNSKLRDLHIKVTEEGSLLKKKGIVSANQEIWLTRPYPELEDYEVVIDGQILNTGGTNAIEYIGMETEYYIASDYAEGPYTIKTIRPTENNNVITFDEHEYSKGGLDGIERMSGEKNLKYSFSPNYTLIKNMRPVTAPVDSDFSLSKGTVKLIDNNGDKLYDIIIITEFSSGLIERIFDNGVIRFKDGMDYKGQRVVNTDADEYIKYIITDCDGNALSLNEIPTESVLSIIASSDRTTYKLISAISKDDEYKQTKISSVLGGYEVSDDGIIATIDGSSYFFESGISPDVVVGDSYDFYLNFRGEIAFTDSVSLNESYGYVLQAGMTKDLGDYRIRMVIPGEFKAEIKVDDSDENNKTEIPILKGRNTALKTINLNSRVNYNGTGMSDENAATRLKSSSQKIIRYKTNSAGLIISIDFPELIGNDIFSTTLKRRYNGYEQIFGGLGNGAFAGSDETQVLCLPDDTGIGSDEDWLAAVEINNNVSYVANGYDLKEKDAAGLIVIQTPLKYSSDYGVDENKIAILQRISTAVDSDDEVITKLSCFIQGKLFTYYAEDDLITSGLQTGDVFKFSLGSSSGKIAKIQILSHLSLMRLGKMPIDPGNTNMFAPWTYYGYPIDVEYDKIDDVNTRRVNVITFGYDANLVSREPVSVNVRNAPYVYIYDRRKSTVTVAEMDMVSGFGEIVSGSELLFIYSFDNRARIMVMVR